MGVLGEIGGEGDESCIGERFGLVDAAIAADEHRHIQTAGQCRQVVTNFAQLQPQVAKELGIPCEQPENVLAPEFLDRLRAFEADLFVVVSYGVILSEEFLAIQLNYYGILTLMAKTGELWLAHCGGGGAAPARISLDDWIDAELRGRDQPQSVE